MLASGEVAAAILASGTTGVIYALLPVIAEVPRKANVHPERPMSISVITGQEVAASPIPRPSWQW